jgi:hypothetical protein
MVFFCFFLLLKSKREHFDLALSQILKKKIIIDIVVLLYVPFESMEGTN